VRIHHFPAESAVSQPGVDHPLSDSVQFLIKLAGQKGRRQLGVEILSQVDDEYVGVVVFEQLFQSGYLEKFSNDA